MKTFEEEYAELVIWCKEAYAEADKKIAELPYIGGHDDRDIIFTRPVTQEWNKRLRELKKKYGKDTNSINTMAQESNSPKANIARV